MMMAPPLPPLPAPLPSYGQAPYAHHSPLSSQDPHSPPSSHSPYSPPPYGGRRAHSYAHASPYSSRHSHATAHAHAHAHAHTQHAHAHSHVHAHGHAQMNGGAAAAAAATGAIGFHANNPRPSFDRLSFDAGVAPPPYSGRPSLETPSSSSTFGFSRRPMRQQSHHYGTPSASPYYRAQHSAASTPDASSTTVARGQSIRLRFLRPRTARTPGILRLRLRLQQHPHAAVTPDASRTFTHDFPCDAAVPDATSANLSESCDACALYVTVPCSLPDGVFVMDVAWTSECPTTELLQSSSRFEVHGGAPLLADDVQNAMLPPSPHSPSPCASPPRMSIDVNAAAAAAAAAAAHHHHHQHHFAGHPHAHVEYTSQAPLQQQHSLPAQPGRSSHLSRLPRPSASQPLPAMPAVAPSSGVSLNPTTGYITALAKGSDGKLLAVAAVPAGTPPRPKWEKKSQQCVEVARNFFRRIVHHPHGQVDYTRGAPTPVPVNGGGDRDRQRGTGGGRPKSTYVLASM